MTGHMKGTIRNRVDRECANDGFKARIKAELAPQQVGTTSLKPPLYSHDATRQSFFNKGWHAVTTMHILQDKQAAKQHAL